MATFLHKLESLTRSPQKMALSAHLDISAKLELKQFVSQALTAMHTL